MKEHFPDALAISFISHQILIELIQVTDEEHWRRVNSLPRGFFDTDVALRYYNGPIHGRELHRHPKPNKEKLHDEYDSTLCFADVVDGLVDDGWTVVPVHVKPNIVSV